MFPHSLTNMQSAHPPHRPQFRSGIPRPFRHRVREWPSSADVSARGCDRLRHARALRRHPHLPAIHGQHLELPVRAGDADGGGYFCTLTGTAAFSLG